MRRTALALSLLVSFAEAEEDRSHVRTVALDARLAAHERAADAFAGEEWGKTRFYVGGEEVGSSGTSRWL